MNFDKQIKWIDNKITELEKITKESESSTKEIQDDINALKSIRTGYKRAEERSISLSWKENPDRMGM